MIKEFCKILKINESDVLGHSRTNGLAIARHIYFWLLYQSGYTYPEIGRLNGRTHATVLRSVRLVDDALNVVDRQIVDMWFKVKDLRASKTEISQHVLLRMFCCPCCSGTGKVVIFEDYLGLEPPESDICEVCEGKGEVLARKIVRCAGNVIIIKN